MRDKYVVYDAEQGDFIPFKTFKEAEDWLIKDVDYSEGIPEEIMDGSSFIAKIIYRTKYVETEKYDPEVYYKYEEECDENCTKEEWPYDNEFDSIGNVVMEEVKNDNI